MRKYGTDALPLEKIMKNIRLDGGLSGLEKGVENALDQR